MNRRFITPKIPFAGLVAIAVTGFNTAASAHAGDHSHMTVAELANHLWSSLDHKLTIMAVVLVMAAAGASVLLSRRKGRARSPETPAT